MEIRPATKDDYDVLFELFSAIQMMHFQTMTGFFKPAVKGKFFYDYFGEILESKDSKLPIRSCGIRLMVY